MNDPNGPMYYNGVYHLFYQYNPYSALWGNITWAHSVSYDLVNWIHLDYALEPTDPFDVNGCWSGSITFLTDGTPAILYTGGDTDNRQVQNIATPKSLLDPFLREWVKSPYNPLMTPVDGIDPNSFRDPTTAWRGPDGIWKLIIGNEMNGHGGALLYRSKDFVTWTRSKNPLHSSTKTGMWECPDFYPVGINSKHGVDTSSQDEFTKHVLKASYNGNDYYVLGAYVHETDHFLVLKDFMGNGSDYRYDYGMFYASKTFFDSAKTRRVLWGWIMEADTESDDIKKGWSGLQSFPRTILLSESGTQLIQWPVEEIEKLRGKNVSFVNEELNAGSLIEVTGITASQADVEVYFDLPNLNEAEPMDSSWVDDPQVLCSQRTSSVEGRVGPFGLLMLASKDLKEQTSVFFRVYKGHDDKYVVLMCTDQTRSTLKEDIEKTTYGAFVDVDLIREKISLRSLIDHSIIESFGGEGRACITSRVYPKLAIGDDARLYAFNNGSQSVVITRLTAWSMKKAHIDGERNDLKIECLG